MPPASLAQFSPRKSPSQARSKATVDAIFQATLQVLITTGGSRLTTTAVAERAGVSVGTLYQYFPNKQSLLIALLDQHLHEVATVMENASDSLRGETLDNVAGGLAKSFLAVKTHDISATRALYRVYAEINVVDVLKQASERIHRAILSCLTSVRDVSFSNPNDVAFAFRLTLSGAVRSLLERDASQAELTILQTELPKVCSAYLNAVAESPRDVQAMASNAS